MKASGVAMGIMTLVGGVAAILILGLAEPRSAAEATNVLVGQGAAALLACFGGMMIAH